AVKAEGEGTLQPDGTILASKIKAKVKDRVEEEEDEAEFEGRVASVDGQTLELIDGTMVVVDENTRFKLEGRDTLGSLAEIADALAAGDAVKAEGEGTLQPDGTILASKIKAKVKEREEERTEFEGTVSSVDSAAQTMTLDDGTVVAVDENTRWKTRGENRLTSFDQVVDAVEGGNRVKVEGKGTLQPDGATILAREIKANIKKSEFEGIVTSVDSAAQTMTLDDGTVVAVDENTKWKTRGDRRLVSFDEVADAVAAGDRVKVEGKGTLQGDGSILASEIKAKRKELD
ncbi:MAG: DUF5666 domain-containing protein, partial [Acidobacteriota bacterium]